VRELIAGTLEAGVRSASWDGRDDSGHSAASGVYLYRLEAAGEVLARRLVEVR
jgi:flagellar hook assembly protein FlgD